MAAFLDGILVLDLSSVGPASRASRWLADYGADVVKVAPVPARAAAQVAPPAHAYSGGRGTRRLLVDLKSDAGREAYLRVSERADVVLESFRPGVATRLGIDYDAIRRRNPRIVYCATSGYGQTGARAGWAGHDLDYLAVSGFLAMTEPTAGGKPALPGTTVADTAGGGLHAVTAILAALVARAGTGIGAFLDVAVADGMLALMALQLDDLLATGKEPGPGTAPLAGRFACYDVYPTSDDRWLAVAAIENRFWRNLCEALGLEQWADRQYDEGAQDDIRDDLSRVLSTKPRDEWVDVLAAEDTCVAPVLSVAEVAADAGFADRGAFTTATAPGAGALRQLAPVLAGTTREPTYDLPERGASDTDAVLGAHGFSAEERAALHAAGAVA